uniref:GH18 domain-containing protein n=1 Tax=Sparus aurata TaxID=8175 RepID=A0A671UY00_SPAAU
MFLHVSASSTRLVCYYDSSAENRVEDGKFQVSDIDPNQCTHLIYAFSDINAQHELVPKNETDIQRYESFNGLKTRSVNPLLKTLLAVGGITFDTRKFRTMASTQQDRTKFIQSVITLLRANGFDGINLDWRYPGGVQSQPEDKQRFTLLTKELKDAFEAEATNRERLIVTASVSAERAIINASYEVAQVAIPLYRGSHDTGDNIYSNTASTGIDTPTAWIPFYLEKFYHCNSCFLSTF